MSNLKIQRLSYLQDMEENIGIEKVSTQYENQRLKACYKALYCMIRKFMDESLLNKK